MKAIFPSTMPTLHATETALPAEDLTALLPPGWPLDAPLARIRTCGPLTVEVVTDLQVGPDGHMHAVYGPPTASLFTIRGMSTALVMLALLASQPGCLASKDFLMQTLAHLRQSAPFSEEDDREEDEDEPLKRLDNVVSLLRKLLCPPVLLTFPGANLLRKRLVRLVRATSESGSGYRLAGFPLLWLDVEAMETYAGRARRLEERGEDGLEDWQAVYQIGMRGPFLGHEPYSAWADWRRGRVAELLWQSVSVQGQRALRWEGGQSGQEAAARLLLDFWQAHVTNEDAFRALIEVLGRQERLQQAEECYTQLCAALEREGRLPQLRTQEMMTALRLAWAGSRAAKKAFAPATEEASVRGESDSFSDHLVPETSHLIGREAWLRGVCQLVQGFPAKKLLIVQGPIGIGKSSELTRLAERFQQTSTRVIWLRLPAADRSSSTVAVLDMVLGTVINQCGVAPFPAEAPRERLITALLAHLRQESRPTVILLDNAECLLEESGTLAACWEAFLAQWVRSRHAGSVLLATNEWQGWPGRERLFVAETMVPPLTTDESVCLLQRQGLNGLPVEQLQALGERMSGIPLLLEWTARLLAEPLLLNDWRGFDEDDTLFQAATTQQSMAKRLQHLLDDPALLSEHLASRLAPLLQRIMDKQLSSEAQQVLQRLAVATIPLGKPALQVLCPRPALLKELKDASLLAAYTNRVQLLPMVAATVQQYLSPEQRYEAEDLLIQACTQWIKQGTLNEQEQSAVINELATLLLKHHRLLEAVEHLIYYGWLSFNEGYGPQLAQLTEQVMQQCNWQETLETECAGLLLQEMLSSFLGKNTDTFWSEHSKQIRDAFLAKEIKLSSGAEYALMHKLMMQAMNNLSFEEAQAILDTYRGYLELRQIPHLDQHVSLLCERALLLGTWCEYAEEQGNRQRVKELREQVIALYRQYGNILLAETVNVQSSFKSSRHKRSLAYCYNYLAYELSRSGQHEESLDLIDRSILLKEEGYVYVGGLAAAYGDKSQILMELGRFQEALSFDEKALAEIQRCAETGDTLPQNEVWIHLVNRGRLYLRLGRLEEAESLLREARPHIRPERRMYRMFAKQALDEIEQWRSQATSPEHQLDWRWIGRFRELVAYDGYGWLAHAGPFTEEEQSQWNRLFRPDADEATWEQLATLMVQSRERELQAALAEEREPQLRYQAIDIEQVRRRIAGLLQLDADVSQQEPNVIVRRLYHEAITYDLDFLRLIEATYEGNTEAFWACNLRSFPLPTSDEVEYALIPIKRRIIRGLEQPETKEVALQLRQFMQARLHLSLDLPTGTEESEEVYLDEQYSAPQPTVSDQAARAFFETALQESGCDGWRVEIDPKAIEPRVEGGLRTFFLPNGRFRLDRVRYWFIHELVGHIGRNVAGERSRLGLLGISTKNYQSTEEGFNRYHERQIEALHGRTPRRPDIWMGTIETGLASGVITPPQTFRSLYTFLDYYALLSQLLRRPDASIEKARQQAREYALHLCLRAFRGVPDLEQAGICYLQDAMYLRGTQMVERAVVEDPTVLDRLAVGKVSLAVLPDLQELGIVSAPQPLRQLAYDPDLDARILSFEQAEEQRNR